MLLLNPFSIPIYPESCWIFTFQYASIKPPRAPATGATYLNLHFNMLLLNPIEEEEGQDYIEHLHFNMLLLNPDLLNNPVSPEYIYISICFY